MKIIIAIIWAFITFFSPEAGLEEIEPELLEQDNG